MHIYKAILKVLFFLATVTVFTATVVFAGQYIDGKSGVTVEYINVNGNDTVRPYFSQIMWCSDNKRFVVGDALTQMLYEYNIETKQFRALDRGNVGGSADIVITPSDNLYYLRKSDKSINCMNMNNYTTRKVANFPDYVTEVSGIQVTNDDKKLTLNWKEDLSSLDKVDGVNRKRRIPVLDIKTGDWELGFSHEFDSPAPHYNVSHIIINPVYTNLIFYCHEGLTTEIKDRLWTLDTNTGLKKNVFKQYDNAVGTTGETSGHESWSSDGENLVFVKYASQQNIGQNGIVRINKTGEKREYINNDYKYWHCHSNEDGRWIVADTQDGTDANGDIWSSIVLIDSKTSKSYYLTTVKIGSIHPFHAHPSFSWDGKMITFGMKDDNGVLCVGYVDVSSIIDNEQPSDVKSGKTNEDRNVLISPIKLVKSGSNITVETNVENKNTDERKFTFIAATCDKITNKLNDILLTAKTIAGGTADKFTASINVKDNNEYKYFLWDMQSGMQPYYLMPTAPEKLRIVRFTTDSAVLSWFPSKNLSDIAGYIIWRDGVEVARVSDTVYNDAGLESNKKYIYEVSSYYDTGLVSPRASVEITTDITAYSILENNLNGNNLSFVDSTNKTQDAYTEAVIYGGRECRKSTLQPTVENPDKYKYGMFYFRVKDSKITSQDKDIMFEVTYFDEGTEDLFIDYNSAEDFAKSCFLVKRTDTKTWKTASLIVSDAMFVKEKKLTSSDFRIRGRENTYIYKVSVYKLNLTAQTKYQAVNCILNSELIENGLALYKNAALESDAYTAQAVKAEKECMYASKGKNFYFNVNDDYMFGTRNRLATITIKYFDEGDGYINLHYNSDDVNLATDKDRAYKKTVIVKKTNTNLWKTAVIKLIDASFINAQDSPYFADFRINSSDECGLYISNIKVVNTF